MYIIEQMVVTCDNCFLFQFCDVASTSSDYPKDNLAKLGYKPHVKVKTFEHPSVLLATYWNKM
jgi:hypothetical protein